MIQSGKLSILLACVVLGLSLSASAVSPQSLVIADDGKLDEDSENLFTFARVQFNSRGRWGGWGGTPGWAHDYPRAERNFLKILAELTTIKTSPESYEVVQLDDPAIMQYPFLYFSEPGTWEITPEEAANFREYLDRGGFAMFDDFDGPRHWQVFYSNFKRVMPEAELEQLTVNDPIFQCFFDIQTLDMVPPQNYGRGWLPQFFGLRNSQGQLQMIVNFNNDLGDYWEWSDEGIHPLPLSNEAYKLGVNYIVYALTH